METKNILITLWIIIIIGMILHFNYHIGEIFYGIDIVIPESTGVVPVSTFVIRTLFYHLPMLLLLVIIYNKKIWINFIMFLLSCLYFLSHLSHVFGEVMEPEKDMSQISLLVIVLIIAGFLSFEHYRYWKKTKENR